LVESCLAEWVLVKWVWSLYL